MVPVKSATWKEAYFFKKIDADHLNQLGWWDKSEAKAGWTKADFEKKIQKVYVDIAEGL